MRRSIAAAGGTALAASLIVRRDLAGRAILGLDRRLDLFAPHGVAVYAWVAPRILRGFYRAVAADAAARLAGRADAIVLDVGAGPGDLIGELVRVLPDALVTGVEPEATMRAAASARGRQVLEGRAENLPVSDGSVDLVVSTLSAHHWDGLGPALAEFCRVLRPDGEVRIYDLRFAAPTTRELEAAAAEAGFRAVSRTVYPARAFVRPFALLRLARDPAVGPADAGRN